MGYYGACIMGYCETCILVTMIVCIMVTVERVGWLLWRSMVYDPNEYVPISYEVGM